MVMNDLKISQKMKNKRQLVMEKDIVKREKKQKFFINILNKI